MSRVSRKFDDFMFENMGCGIFGLIGLVGLILVGMMVMSALESRRQQNECAASGGAWRVTHVLHHQGYDTQGNPQAWDEDAYGCVKGY